VRLFVAVDLPEGAAALVAALPRPALPAVHWTTPEQWHVTVRFLGEVDPAQLGGPSGLCAALDGVPSALRHGGAGPVGAVLGPAVAWFPGRHVLQVPVRGLEALARAVAAASASWGDPPERDFRGHLTLARTRRRASGPPSLAGAPIVAHWLVPELVLYESTLGPGASRYRALHRVALPG